MIVAILTLVLSAQDPVVETPNSVETVERGHSESDDSPVLDPDGGLGAAVGDASPVETIEFGGGSSVTGRVIKSTADTLFVDVGFDVLRVPIASVVRRGVLGAIENTTIQDEGVYYRAQRVEKSVAEGSREVGPAVVKIESAGGQGSGFIVNQSGMVVTNFHVVEGETEVDVKLFLRRGDELEQRTIRKCKVIAANPDMDLALVKIEPPTDLELPFVFLGDSEAVEVGERVYAIGTPIGLERTVSSGIVSVDNRAFGGRTHLQITTPINPGNSGGPLFNLRGEVIGVNSSGYVGLQGLNFAIPTKYVIDFLRNRDAFAVDTTRSENGIHYLPAPRKPDAETSPGARD